MMDLRPDPSRFQIGQQIREASGFAIEVQTIDSKARSISARVVGTEPSSAEAIPLTTLLQFEPCRLTRGWVASSKGFDISLGGPSLLGFGADTLGPPVSHDFLGAKFHCG